jgi:hypothetical protein
MRAETRQSEGKTKTPLKKAPMENIEGCPDTCTVLHSLKRFAALNNVSPRTVRRWKQRGMPGKKKIPCKDAREWILGNL